MTVIELTEVTKHYGSATAISDLSFSVAEGEVFGFLGPNGAGKSTTINVLLGYARPSSGTIGVLGTTRGRELVTAKERVGVLPEQCDVFERMSGRQHVRFAIRAKHGDDDPDALLERVGIGDAGGRRASSYSTGMRQRLLLAMALAGNPELLVLDEPSTGLDPHGVRIMREIVREERDRGTAVFFSSHILSQVEAVADRVGILDNGDLVALDSVEGLRSAVGAVARLVVTVDQTPVDALDAVSRIEGVTDVSNQETTVFVSCDAAAKFPALEAIADSGAVIRDVVSQEPALEDLFVAYTQDQP